MTKTERIELRIEPELVSAIDAWRRDQPDIPTRPEAVRRMVAAATEGRIKRRPAHHGG